MLRALLMTLMLVSSTSAQAFCGFYVSGADASLYNDATLTVLMRSGQRTVLSMQNTYQGPPEAFAMVVPVPQVLQKENVKTLPAEIFKRVDQLAAPRLVEYWERDPCQEERLVKPMMSPAMRPSGVSAKVGSGASLGVTIEAQFEVGEYDIVILSAKDSGGLDTWLRQEKYNIPEGAEPVLRPYVESGTKFFVAKVDPEKVTFSEGRAVLSPLRVDYDSETFSLPVRLGLLNSSGEQDLLVHILAPNQRYEMANYNNAFIPTNLRVKNAVRDGFGSFYDALFREVSKQPRTVVTEYAWDAGTCDPCPTPALTSKEIATLGGDVIGVNTSRSMVLTRLHYRYGADGLDEDLVFRAAGSAYGGRGTPNAEGEMTEQGATVSEAPIGTITSASKGTTAELGPSQTSTVFDTTVGIGTTKVNMSSGDEEDITRTVRRYSGQLKYCYEVRLKEKPDLSGKVTLEWTVAEGAEPTSISKVTDVKVTKNTTGDSELGSCFMAKLKRWRFPAETSGKASQPFTLSAVASEQTVRSRPPPPPSRSSGPRNNFQGRYIILHHWEGEVACAEPRHGRWGGPNNSKSIQKPQAAASRMSSGSVAAKGAPPLSALLIDALPAMAMASDVPPPVEDAQATEPPEVEEAEKPEGGASELGCSSLGAAAGSWLLVLPWMRRRRIRG